MTIDEVIAKEREVAGLCRDALLPLYEEHEQVAKWLEELKVHRQQQSRGISICILTYNVFFYNRVALKQIRELTKNTNYEILILDNGSDDGSYEWLQTQPDVKLFRSAHKNQFRHGSALDFLLKECKYPITCTLCSDAFPTSPEWIVPALWLDDETILAGATRGGRQIDSYVCPSYLFGWTDWLKKRSFLDAWPSLDTGEQLGIDCQKEGKKIRAVPVNPFKLEEFSPKPCDYNGWAWHVWWGGRYKTIPWVVGMEVEEGYHDAMKRYVSKRFNVEV